MLHHTVGERLVSLLHNDLAVPYSVHTSMRKVALETRKVVISCPGDLFVIENDICIDI